MNLVPGTQNIPVELGKHLVNVPLNPEALGAPGGLLNVMHWLTLLDGEDITWLVTYEPRVEVRLERDTSGLIGYEVTNGHALLASGFTDLVAMVSCLERAIVDFVSICRSASVAAV